MQQTPTAMAQMARKGPFKSQNINIFLIDVWTKQGATFGVIRTMAFLSTTRRHLWLKKHIPSNNSQMPWQVERTNWNTINKNKSWSGGN